MKEQKRRKMDKDLRERSLFFSNFIPSPRPTSHSGAYLGLIFQGEGVEGRLSNGVGESDPGRAAFGLGQQRVEVGVELGLMEKKGRGEARAQD